MGWRWGPSVRVCVRVVRARSRAFVPECMRRPSESRGPRQRRRGQDGDGERETHMWPVRQGARARARAGARVCVCEVHAAARARSCVSVCRADAGAPKSRRRPHPKSATGSATGSALQRRCSAASLRCRAQGPYFGQPRQHRPSPAPVPGSSLNVRVGY